MTSATEVFLFCYSISVTYTIIDVRAPEEYAEGHVVGSLNIQISEMKSGSRQLSELPKDAPIIVYCRSGNRSNASKSFLEELGYTNVINGTSQRIVESRYL